MKSKSKKDNKTDALPANREQQESPTRSRPTIPPDCDIYENDQEFLLVADLPGVNNGDIRLEMDGTELTLFASREEDASEQPSGRSFTIDDFFRSFRVSQQIDTANLSANLDNGVLTVHLPKVPEASPKQITVH